MRLISSGFFPILVKRTLNLSFVVVVAAQGTRVQQWGVPIRQRMAFEMASLLHHHFTLATGAADRHYHYEQDC